MADFLPRQDVALTDQAQRTTTPFYVWLQSIERALQTGAGTNVEITAQIAAIATALGSPDGTVANIPAQGSDIGLVLGQQSIQHIGVLTTGNVFLTLVGDQQSPGASYYYGTDVAGKKGWQPRTLADTGIGAALVRITRDAFGRVEGTEAVVPADIPTYQHIQASALSTWTINHNLGRKVAVAVFTVGGVAMFADVVNVSVNQVQVIFDTAIDGYAILN